MLCFSYQGTFVMKRIFYGWWIVVATGLIHFWIGGTFFYSFTAFFNPIVDEFGWSYAAISFAASLRSIEGGIVSPLVGFAVDRYGARRLLLLGSILSGFGFILFSHINALWTFYATFILLSIGSSLLAPIPGWTAVTNWFLRKRGTTIGLLSAAGGMCGMLIYAVNWLIAIYGWRISLIIIGIGTLVIGIPSSLIVRHRPEPYGLFPDGERTSEASSISQKNHKQPDLAKDFSTKQALLTKTFWFIAITMTISGAAIHSVFVHVMPYLISVRFSREMASLVASLVVLTSILGRFGFGWIESRIKKRYLLVFALLLQALGLLFLAKARTLGDAIIFIAFFGPGYGGGITIRLTIQAEYFGRRAFGAIQGAIMAIMVIGTMTGPLLTGWIFDLYGSYYKAWIINSAVIFASIPLALMATEPYLRKRLNGS